MDILNMTAVSLGEKIKAKEISVREATQASLDQIAKTEEKINAFVSYDAEKALAQADEVQKKVDAGELQGPLAGVPVAIKDNMCISGVKTTCSSKILENFNSSK